MRTILFKAKQVYGKNFINSPIDKGLFYCAGRENIGDSVVPWLIKNITSKDYEYSNPLERKGMHLLSIGSILQSATKDCIVWGSGFIAANSSYKSRPISMSCVRGPLTAKRIRYLGGIEPVVYCDPGLIIPHYLVPGTIIGNNKIGLILHYADKKWTHQIEIAKDTNVELIDVETSNIQLFVEQILQCDYIISSSLHGVIISEAFGVPAIWGKCANDVYGNDFKFHDYYNSTDRQVEPLNLLKATAKDILSPKIISSKQLRDLANVALSVFPSDYL